MSIPATRDWGFVDRYGVDDDAMPQQITSSTALIEHR